MRVCFKGPCLELEYFKVPLHLLFNVRVVRMENMFRLSNGQATTKRLKTDAEGYKASANDCITLHLIDPAKTTSSWPPNSVSSSFKPDFTHQIFGEDEEIVGYRGLTVDIYFSQVDFQACVEVKFEDKAHKATDIVSTLQKHFPGGITADREQYVAAVAAASPADLGHALTEAKAGVTIREANLATSGQGLQVSCKVLESWLSGTSIYSTVHTHLSACRLCILDCNLSSSSL